MTQEDFSYLFGKDKKMKIWRASHIVHCALVRHFANCICCIGLFTISITNSTAFLFLQCGGGDFFWYTFNTPVLKYKILMNWSDSHCHEWFYKEFAEMYQELYGWLHGATQPSSVGMSECSHSRMATRQCCGCFL